MLSQRSFRHLLSAAAPLLFATAQPATAQDVALTPGITGQPKGLGALCPNDGYVSGLWVRLTDRVTSLWMTCHSATWNGLWGAGAGTDVPIAGDTGGYQVPLSCPPDYFITGLGYLQGHYSEDTYGLAKPTSQDLIADLRPVCRLQLGSPYMLNRNYLDQAEDNAVKETFWQDGNPRDCPFGFAANGVAVWFEARRADGMQNTFYDVALYCKRLRTAPIPGLNRVPAPRPLPGGIDRVPQPHPIPGIDRVPPPRPIPGIDRVPPPPPGPPLDRVSPPPTPPAPERG